MYYNLHIVPANNLWGPLSNSYRINMGPIGTLRPITDIKADIDTAVRYVLAAQDVKNFILKVSDFPLEVQPYLDVFKGLPRLEFNH